MGWKETFFGKPPHNGEIRSPSGQPYHWRYIPGSNKTPARAEASIPVDVTYELSFEREHFGRWLAKALGFAKEFQTGDEKFDKKVYILSDDPQIGDKLQSDVELRQTLQGLFEFGVDSVKLGKGRLTIAMTRTYSRLDLLGAGAVSMTLPAKAVDSYRAVSPMLDEHNAEAIVQALYTLKRKLHMNTPTMFGEVSRTVDYKTYARVFNSISGTLLVAGIALFVFDRAARPEIVHFTDFLLHTLSYSGAVITIFLALLFLILGRSSSGYGVLRNFLLMGVIGIGLCTSEAVYSVNVMLDESTATEHRQQVVGTHYSRSRKGGTRYYIDVNGWNAGQANYSFKVDHNTYQTANGKRINIYTHPGYLGYEWIERYEILR